MKPNFALNLSYEGMSLLHRATGGWRMVGEISLDDPEMAEKIRFLRRTATELSGGQFATKLVIPNSQILFRDVVAPGDTPGARRVEIRRALDGTTPYALDDLVFDWSDAGDDLAKVAVVASVTLEEAETFAANHRLNPVSFVASPEPGDFIGEPWFGTTRLANGLLANGETVERDDSAIVIVGPPKSADTTEGDKQKSHFISVPEQTTAVSESIKNPSASVREPLAIGGIETTLDPDRKPAGKSAAALEQEQELHVLDETGTSDDPAKPGLETPVSELAFATRRAMAGTAGAIGAEPSEIVPLRLENVSPRIALVADKTAPANFVELPRLGIDNRPAEVTHLSVTAPETADDDRDTPLSDPDKATSRAKKPNLSLLSATVGQPPAARAASVAGSDLAKTPTELTVFGARKTAPVGGKPRYLGLVLVLALILALAAAALLSNYILGNGSIVSRVFRPADPVATLTPAPTTLDQDKAPLPSDGGRVAGLMPPESSDTTAEPQEPMTREGPEATYQVSGVWSLDPTAPIDSDTDRIDDLYIASIDPVVVGHDAVALPDVEATLLDVPPAAVQSPAPVGTDFELDDRGLVRATPDGALSPDGVVVFAGKPPQTPAPRPSLTTDQVISQPDELAGFRPRARPGNLIEANERSRLGGRTLSQLASLRPQPRPASAQEDQAGTETPATKLAVLKSPSPASRPSDFSRIVEKAIAEAQSSAPDTSEGATVVTTASATVAAPKLPAVPTRASVAKEATVANAINLGNINLIGVYGSSANRRALIRLSTGKYVKVQVGDRVDGGQVAAISASEVLYIKRGRKVTLAMPKG